MSRHYLYVPFQDKSEVERLGALWDRATLRWYLTARHNPDDFRRWLSPDNGRVADSPRHPIESGHSYIAHTQSPCQHCGVSIPVICVFCEAGNYQGEPLKDFSVINITAMDHVLEGQLSPWPFFRRSGGVYRNHCPRCLSPQEDLDLHCEPDGVFFHMSAHARRRMSMTRLQGVVRLNGDETFEA